MRLLPCETCRRHVRVSEKSCPFCGTSLPGAVASRALAAPAAALALLLACGKQVPTANADRAGDIANGASPPAPSLQTPPPPARDDRASEAGTDALAAQTPAPQTRLEIRQFAIPVPPYGVPPSRPTAPILPGNKVNVLIDGTGVVVSENGKKLGVTPCSVPLTLGPHTLVLEDPAHHLRTRVDVVVTETEPRWEVEQVP
jgi:hypothetical protein